MTEKRNNHAAGAGCLSMLFMPIIFGAIAYLVYGSSGDAAVAVFLYSLALIVIAYVGFIPIAGPFIYYFVGKWAASSILSWAGIAATGLTGFIFILYLGITILMSLFITLAIFYHYESWYRYRR